LVFVILITKNRVAIFFMSVAAFGVGLAIFGVLPGVREYLAESINVTSRESYNLLNRIDLTTSLLQVFTENPIFGFGPGMIQKLGLGGSGEFIRFAGLENQYAVILAEGGALAGTAYALFIGGVFGLLWKIRRAGMNNTLRYMSLMSLLLFVFVFAGAASANFLVGPVLNTIMVVYAVTVASYETAGALASIRDQKFEVPKLLPHSSSYKQAIQDYQKVYTQNHPV